MISVSTEFKNLMKERTDFKCNATVTLASGSTLTLDGEDFTLSNNSVTDAADSNTFPLGVAISRTIQLELMNDDDRYKNVNFFGAKIRLYLTFQLSRTTEKVELGTFTVLDPETYGETVIITARDDMYKADRVYSSSLSYPATLATIFRDACNICGLSYSTSTFTNSTFTVQQAPPSDITFRQLFGYIAMIAGGNARISRTGYMQILTYNLGTAQHTLSGWKTLKADTSDVTITGIQTVAETTDADGNTTESTIINGAEGYVIKVENPLIVGQEENAIALIAAKVVNKPFRKFSGDHIGYPIAEFMDVAQITDRKGNTYKSVLTDINFAFFGFTTMSNSAESTVRQGSTYYSDSTKAVIAAKKLVEQEKTQRELAMEKLNETLANSSGLYETSEKQADGSTIYYLHDKPTIAESTNVIKLTGEAIGLSTDGGKTYPYGFMLTGDMVAKILAAEGINADWINTGALTVTDASGKIVFRVDVATGEVTINGTSGGVSLENTPIYTISEKTWVARDYTEDDVFKALRISLFVEEGTAEEILKYDINGNGMVDNDDVLAILSMANYGVNIHIIWRCRIDPTDRGSVFRVWQETTSADSATGKVSTTITDVLKSGVGGNVMSNLDITGTLKVNGYEHRNAPLPKEITTAEHALGRSDVDTLCFFSYDLKNEEIFVDLIGSSTADIPVGAEVAVVRSWGANVNIRTSGVRMGASGGASELTTTDQQTFAISKPFGVVVLKKIESSAESGDVWLIMGDLGAEASAEEQTITAGQTIPISIEPGEILQVTYLANALTSGDITLKVDGEVPGGSWYNPANENATYSGGIITAGGTTTYATSQFSMQIIGDRLLVWGSGIRGTGGLGTFNAFWRNTAPTNIAISRAGTLKIKRI